MTATRIDCIRLSQLEPVAFDGLLHRATWAAIDGYSTEGAICGANPRVFARRNGSEPRCPVCNFRSRLAAKRNRD